jgi:hypothetical protein
MRAKAILSTFLYLITLIGLSASSKFQAETEGNIQSPHPGEAIQGLVQISGTTIIDGFSSFELSFSFENDSTNTWFLINRSQEPVDNDVLGEWDTSVLSDGDYALKLSINRLENSPIIVLVEGIRVRNYSPIETGFPTEVPTAISSAQTKNAPTTSPPTNTSAPQFTPTPLFKNSAEIAPLQIYSSVRRGAIIAALILGILGLYAASRRRQ